MLPLTLAPSSEVPSTAAVTTTLNEESQSLDVPGTSVVIIALTSALQSQSEVSQYKEINEVKVAEFEELVRLTPYLEFITTFNEAELLFLSREAERFPCKAHARLKVS